MKENSPTTQDSSKMITGVFFIVALSIFIVLSLTLVDPNPLAVVALGVFLALFPLFFLQPKHAFFLLLIIRPAIDFIGQNVNFNIQDIVTLNVNAMLSLFVFAWSLWYLLVYRKSVFRPTMVLSLFALSLITLIMTYFAEDRVIAFGEWVRITNYGLLFLLGYHFTESLHDVTSLIKSIVYSSIVPLIFGLYQLITSTGISDEASSNRIYGTFAHPALFGHYLAFLLVLLLAFILAQHRKNAAYEIWWFVLGCFLVATFTRGAWIFAALGCLILAFRFFPRKLFQGAGVAIGSLVVFACIILFLQSFTSFHPLETELVSRVVESFRATPDSSTLWRFEFWTNVLEPVPLPHLTGYGPASFVSYALNELNAEFDAHNDYIKLYIELGLFGVVIFILLWFRLLVTSIQKIRQSQDQLHKIYAFALFAEIIGFMLISFFDNLYQNTTLYWLFVSLSGSLIALLSTTKKRRSL